MNKTWGENWDLLALLPSALPICALWTSGENCGLLALLPSATLSREQVVRIIHYVD